MGLMNESEFELSVILILFCGLVFLGAVLRVFYYIARDVEKGSDQLVDDGDVVCKCIFKQCTPWLLTMYCTMSAVVCFFVACFAALIGPILYFSVCDDCTLDKVFWIIKNLFVILGYAMMFVSHFQRLRLTFIGSALALPKWAPKVMYVVLLLFVVLFFGTIGFRHSQPTLSALSATLTIVLYFAVVCVLIRVFFNKTMATANMTPPDEVLQEAAVRITIVVTVSLLSTTLNFLQWAAILWMCPMCYVWMAVGNFVMVCDQCLNAFCLMCTFGSSVKAYMRVFGGMHVAFVARLKTVLPQMETQMVRKRVSSMTGNDDLSHDPDTVSHAI